MPAPTELENRLAAAGQAGLLRFWDELDEGGRWTLAGEIDAIDFDRITKLFAAKNAGPVDDG
ncbi:MAG: hypothetical protein AAGJ97_15350, partial [Planctomycetota bacterium]